MPQWEPEATAAQSTERRSLKLRPPETTRRGRAVCFHARVQQIHPRQARFHVREGAANIARSGTRISVAYFARELALTRHLRKAQDREGKGSTHEFKRRRRRRLTAVISTVERPVIDERVDRGALARDRGCRASRGRHVRRAEVAGRGRLRLCVRPLRWAVSRLSGGLLAVLCGCRKGVGELDAPARRDAGHLVGGPSRRAQGIAVAVPGVESGSAGIRQGGSEAQIAYLKKIEGSAFFNAVRTDLAGHVLLAQVRRQFPGPAGR